MIKMSRFKSCNSLPKLMRFGVDFGIQSGPPSQMMVTAVLFSPKTIGCKISFMLDTCIALVLLWNIDGHKNTLSKPDLGNLIRSLPSVSTNIFPLKLRLEQNSLGGADEEQCFLFESAC